MNDIFLLSRDDMICVKNGKDVSSVRLDDFKQSSLSKDELLKANIIFFDDGINTKLFKHRIKRIKN